MQLKLVRHLRLISSVRARGSLHLANKAELLRKTMKIYLPASTDGRRSVYDASKKATVEPTARVQLHQLNELKGMETCGKT